MRLGDWLNAKHMPASDFAAKIGVDKSTVGRWVSGESVPRRDQMILIGEVTDQAVTANDCLAAAADYRAVQQMQPQPPPEDAAA